MISEPDVTLTDFALAIEGVLFAYLIGRGDSRDQRLTRWFTLLFLASSVGAMAGALVHGFFTDETSAPEQILWPLSLIALGAGAMAVWSIGAPLAFDGKWSHRVIRVAQVQFLLYAGAIALGFKSFGLVVLNYLPAAFLLLAVFVSRWSMTRDQGFLLGAVAMVLTFVAAGVQQLGIDLGIKSLSPNALYHIIQGFSLVFLFASAQRISRRGNL